MEWTVHKAVTAGVAFLFLGVSNMIEAGALHGQALYWGLAFTNAVGFVGGTTAVWRVPNALVNRTRPSGGDSGPGAGQVEPYPPVQEPGPPAGGTR